MSTNRNLLCKIPILLIYKSWRKKLTISFIRVSFSWCSNNTLDLIGLAEWNGIISFLKCSLGNFSGASQAANIIYTNRAWGTFITDFVSIIWVLANSVTLVNITAFTANVGVTIFTWTTVIFSFLIYAFSICFGTCVSAIFTFIDIITINSVSLIALTGLDRNR